VVRPYKFAKGRFVIVEGNRRVVAMRWLKKDMEGGSAIPKKLIRVSIASQLYLSKELKKKTKNIQHILMGLRHVSGIKQWGGYQRAKLVAEFVDELV